MQNAGNHYFYIFNWQDGHITDWNNISSEECNIAGNILGKIHAINPRNVSHKEPQLSEINWQEYVHKANEGKNEIASILTDNVQLLIYAQKELNMARVSLPDIMCLSNEDMDPKNIMWDKGNAWVIDLECLDYGNPISHALQLALQWSGISTCNMDIEKMIAFFDGYLTAYDNCFRSYSDVFGLAYTWVEWLEYNIQRALGACVDEAERMLGISEVKNTVDRIKYIKDTESKIKKALDSRLHPIQAARYDNHDEQICYYETKPAELSNRMFFIETNKGEKIATATAFYDIHGRDTSNDGWLHWVAVKREYQGKGLSKPLITYVLKMMNKLGHVHAKIPTQTNTWLACKVYMDLGFVPVKKNLKHNYEGWKIIKALTDHDTLQTL